MEWLSYIFSVDFLREFIPLVFFSVLWYFVLRPSSTKANDKSKGIDNVKHPHEEGEIGSTKSNDFTEKRISKAEIGGEKENIVYLLLISLGGNTTAYRKKCSSKHKKDRKRD